MIKTILIIIKKELNRFSYNKKKQKKKVIKKQNNYNLDKKIFKQL